MIKRKLSKKESMNRLNFDIMNVDCKGRIGLGSGSLNPKFIFIGQNPGEKIYNGYKFFSNPKDGSSQLILPLLEKLKVLKSCYFTNLIHSTTENNAIPTINLFELWWPYFKRELEIVRDKNQTIIAMGSWTSDILKLKRIKHHKIHHPAYIRHQKPNLKKEYEQEIKTIIESNIRKPEKISKKDRETVF